MSLQHLPTELESRLESLTNELVPPSGAAETLEGELLRAVNRILYRLYNDGDYWHTGYGIETVGPAVAFLMDKSPVPVSDDLKKSDHLYNQDYELLVFEVTKKIVGYVESRNANYSPNDCDMLDYTPQYTYDDDDYYYDDDYYDDDDYDDDDYDDDYYDDDYYDDDDYADD